MSPSADGGLPGGAGAERSYASPGSGGDGSYGGGPSHGGGPSPAGEGPRNGESTCTGRPPHADGPALPGSGSWAEQAAALGPFFAVELHAPGAAPGPPWRSMGELTGGSAVLGERVAAVRGLLAAGGGQPPEAVELRVAASVTHLGLVARVLSPCLVPALLDGRAPVLPHLADASWQPALGGPFPLSLPSALGSPPGPASEGDADLPALADALAAGLLDGPVRELAAAFAPLGVSPHILRGNTASAVHGAAAMAASARPGLVPRARTLAALLLERPPLRGAAERTAAGAFRRRSCCLIYRAAPGGAGALCGDCALRRDTD